MEVRSNFGENGQEEGLTFPALVVAVVLRNSFIESLSVQLVRAADVNTVRV